MTRKGHPARRFGHTLLSPARPGNVPFVATTQPVRTGSGRRAGVSEELRAAAASGTPARTRLGTPRRQTPDARTVAYRPGPAPGFRGGDGTTRPAQAFRRHHNQAYATTLCSRLPSWRPSNRAVTCPVVTSPASEGFHCARDSVASACLRVDLYGTFGLPAVTDQQDADGRHRRTAAPPTALRDPRGQHPRRVRASGRAACGGGPQAGGGRHRSLGCARRTRGAPGGRTEPALRGGVTAAARPRGPARGSSVINRPGYARGMGKVAIGCRRGIVALPGAPPPG